MTISYVDGPGTRERSRFQSDICMVCTVQKSDGRGGGKMGVDGAQDGG